MADLPCPTCGNPLTFLEQYHRHYCHRCGQYAPEGYGDRGALHCPACGGILSYVGQYNRFYCYHCNAYAPEALATPAKEAAAPQTPSAAEATPVAPPAAATEPAPAAAAPVLSPTPAETTLVPATAQAPVTPTAQPSTEAAAKAEPSVPVATPAAQSAPSPEPTAASAEPLQPAEPESPEPSREIRALSASKPAAVRVKVFAMKKAELIDLCKVYSLDPSGTKDQLQERLLSYLHDLEAEEQTEAPHGDDLEPSPAPTESREPAVHDLEPQVTPASPATTAAQTTVQVEEPRPAPAVEPAPAPIPVVIVTPVAAPAAVAETSRPVPKAEHPCPTCGRELTYISQYGRYYCYYCQRYAPIARSKNACPTCGTTMRWIDQHQRWWCDACQKYASADLPKPESPAMAARPAASAAVATPMVTRVAATHRHASPAMGIGLVGLGLTLFILYEFFAILAPAMNLGINNPFPGGLGNVMTFLAFLFVAAGAMIGLSSVRDRP